MEVNPLGKGHAWQQDGCWYFTQRKANAPAQAIDVEGYIADGKVLLHQADGQHGRFIRGAEQVR